MHTTVGLDVSQRHSSDDNIVDSFNTRARGVSIRRNAKIYCPFFEEKRNAFILHYLSGLSDLVPICTPASEYIQYTRSC